MNHTALTHSHQGKMLSPLIDFEAKRLGYYPSVLHSNRGREFIKSSMEEYFKKHLICCRTSNPYTPQQNRLAKRHNWTIIESLRSILKDSGLSKKLYPFAPEQKISLQIVQTLNSALGKSSGSKIFPKGLLGKFLGNFDTKSVTFLEFVPKSQKISDEEDFKIVVEDLWNKSTSSDQIILQKDPVTPLEEPPVNDSLIHDNTQVKMMLWFLDLLVHIPPELLGKERPKSDLSSTATKSNPSNLKRDPEKEAWKSATDAELDKIEAQNVWEDVFNEAIRFQHSARSESLETSLTLLEPKNVDYSNAVKFYTNCHRVVSFWLGSTLCLIRMTQRMTPTPHADDLESRLSRSGSICFIMSCPISWNRKKQKNITLSLTEAELNALSEELWKEKIDPSKFHVYNQGLIEKIKCFGSNAKTKHLGIKMKWLCDLASKNEINFKLIPSEDMVGDALTKASEIHSLKKLQE
ncbi:hypothetical protein VP01_4509g1 [Puccinia sorghi]|uniref:Integrase catalytic domain-containing protein n=1 Tax=Puccinia sorghi TaxID=27349 RepID=A0A0L6UR27_9BASI|nr:hypothetical protein VP01_4509g1 [Puccinia sorghi]